jgi:hypothetical protein
MFEGRKKGKQRKVRKTGDERNNVVEILLPQRQCASKDQV